MKEKKWNGTVKTIEEINKPKDTKNRWSAKVLSIEEVGDIKALEE